MENENDCCGSCTYFEREDIYGNGWCPRQHAVAECGDQKCIEFKLKEEDKQNGK